jgi:pimeloyl-ACP methyl ester carboxylesterase
MTDNPVRRSRETLRIDRTFERRATIAVDGRVAPYHEIGDSGPTIILAHAPGSAYERWEPLVRTLSNRFRMLVPRLLGYGRVETPADDIRLHPWSDCSLLLALAEQAGGAVHLVGHSYGGAVALETARALGKRARSLTLIEPIGIHLLRLREQMRDWREIPSYRRLDTPTRLIVSQWAPTPAWVITDELLRLLPDTHLRVLPRAGHMSPLTHPAELSELVTEHVDTVEARPEPVLDDAAPKREHRRSIA